MKCSTTTSRILLKVFKKYIDYSLSIIQVEPLGKAECGGLKVGDVLFGINKVPLSGSRLEAIHLVKLSPHTLTLHVERFESCFSCCMFNLLKAL